MQLSEHFSAGEFACDCGCGHGRGDDDVSEDLLDLLEDIREDLGKPMRVTSGCRCAAHNADVGGVPNSAHTRGTACDIYCVGGLNRRRLVDLAVRHGAAGIGVAKTFIHLDCCDVLPRPAIWSY